MHNDPGYYLLFAKLKLAQARIIGVKRLATGPDPDDLAAKATDGQAKLFSRSLWRITQLAVRSTCPPPTRFCRSPFVTDF
jgi:DNA-binding transcriptional MocR family regulator